MKSKQTCSRNMNGYIGFDEACDYLQVNESVLLGLVSARSIPYYFPGKKLLYFKQEELDMWIEQSRHEMMSRKSELSRLQPVDTLSHPRKVKEKEPTVIGWCYDDEGNIKNVYAPIRESGDEILIRPGCQTGQLGDEVGFSKLG